MIFPIKLQVLDYVARKGKGENPKTYHNLYCYQQGSQYPTLIEISVSPELVTEVQGLIGSETEIRVDQYEYSGKSRYSYIGQVVQG